MSCTLHLAVGSTSTLHLHTKYLGVTLQSNLTFNLHIAEKSIKSNKLLCGMKHLMRNAGQETKLLPYTSLCRSILECADDLSSLSLFLVDILNRSVKYIRICENQCGSSFN